MALPIYRPAFVFFVAAVAAGGGFLFGYDTAVVNGANTYLKAHFGLGSAQEGIAAASAILGCIPGAMFAGVLSERWGRRKMLLACAALFAVSGLCSAIPTDFSQFLVARLANGVAIGASSMICPIYIAEISPGNWRGRLGSLFQLGIVTGIFLTLFINRVIQGRGDEAWNAAVGWRWMLGLESAPGLLFLAFLFTVPESPRWLARKGQRDQARTVLTRLTGPDQADRDLAAIGEAGGRDHGGFAALWAKPYLRPVAIAMALMAFTQFSGINAVMYYSTKIFREAGAGANAAFTASVWVGLTNLVFTFVAMALVDRAGRKPLLLLGAAMQSLALGAVGTMFHMEQSGLPLLLAVIAFIAAFALAMGPIGWLFCSEVFPSEVRSHAMSVAALTVWTANYLVTQTFPILNDSPSIGPAKTFWLYAGASAGALWFVHACLPETKGLTLEEIGAHWTKRPLAGKP